MLKTDKKTLSIIAVCILAIALVTTIATTSAASTSGTDLSVLNIVKDIQNKIAALLDQESANIQIVTYSGSFELKAGETLSELNTIATVYVNGPGGTPYDSEVDWSKAADFQLSLRGYMSGDTGPGDSLSDDYDILWVSGGTGNPQVGFTALILEEDEIINGWTPLSFNGNSMSITLQTYGDVVKYDTTIYYSYTVTTSADATITEIHNNSPLP